MDNDRGPQRDMVVNEYEKDLRKKGLRYDGCSVPKSYTCMFACLHEHMQKCVCMCSSQVYICIYLKTTVDTVLYWLFRYS